MDRNSRRHVRLVRRRILAAVDGRLRLAELLVGRCVSDPALEAVHVVIGGTAAEAGVSKGFMGYGRSSYPLGVQSHWWRVSVLTKRREWTTYSADADVVRATRQVGRDLVLYFTVEPGRAVGSM